jgi:SAM-dependent methyltransferase
VNIFNSHKSVQPMATCKICANPHKNTTHQAQEMMLGLKDVFEYLECSNCGCIQLVTAPVSWERYYPPDEYYSFNSKEKHNSKYSLSDYLRRVKSRYLLHRNNKIMGKLLCIGYIIPSHYTWLKKANAHYHTSILDLGCGGGELLLRLHRIGFRNLTGADPFIKRDGMVNGIKIYKKDVFSLQDKYEFIMLNHSFEHMEEPLNVLKKLHELLLPGGCLLIRIPVADSYCWRKYGVYWAPLDAPRHLYIHSAASMKIMADQAGFVIREAVHDAGPFQFWGSEQYKKGIALTDPDSYNRSKRKSIFSKKEIAIFQQRIDELNSLQQGGEAAFYMYKK